MFFSAFQKNYQESWNNGELITAQLLWYRCGFTYITHCYGYSVYQYTKPVKGNIFSKIKEQIQSTRITSVDKNQ